MADRADGPEPPGQALEGLGDRVRRRREERGLAPAALAERAGLDTAQLGDLEGGGPTPALEVLARLADALDIDLSELFTDTKPGPAVVVLRGDEARTVVDEGLVLQVLTPRAVIPGMYAARYRLTRTAEGVRPVRHVGHDWLYVLSGELLVEFSEDSTTLRAGDSVSFSSRVPHRLSAVGREPAEFLAVGATLAE
ncbi:helix-turn-helix domain-containing protein [Saccharopolyspora sp. CA-218241]|uniref:helix-turn-helix domain-containing protein n=1 Tax=Saccharopolyspora sp. CA-218241 TaxID=3240027 RepID=UPI003D978C17